MTNIHPTREAWFTAAAVGLTPWLADAGAPLTVPVRLAMGFPSSRALSLKKRTIGECWAYTASSDGTAEILVSPLLDAPLDILGVVAHELGHAALGQDVGHKAPFARLMVKLSLEGKPTATVVGPAFAERAGYLLTALGPLPHSRLDPSLRPRKKDGIRQIKCACGVCGYVARTSRKWLSAAGAPWCPTDRVQMIEDGADA